MSKTRGDINNVKQRRGEIYSSKKKEMNITSERKAKKSRQGETNTMSERREGRQWDIYTMSDITNTGKLYNVRKKGRQM